MRLPLIHTGAQGRSATYATAKTNAVGSDEWIGIDDINVSSVVFAGGPDTTAPALLSSSPADNATDVSASANIVLTFDEPVALGSGAAAGGSTVSGR